MTTPTPAYELYPDAAAERLAVAVSTSYLDALATWLSGEVHARGICVGWSPMLRWLVERTTLTYRDPVAPAPITYPTLGTGRLWPVPSRPEDTEGPSLSAYELAVLADGPAGFWLDSSGLDSSGNGRHLTEPTAFLRVTSPLTGREIVRNAATSYSGYESTFSHFRAEHGGWLNSPSITLEGIVHWTPSGSTQQTLFSRHSGSSQASWRLGFHGDGRFNTPIWPGGQLYNPTTSYQLTAGTHHVGLTFDAATGVLCHYVDGEAVNTLSAWAQGFAANTAELTIGATKGGTTSTSMFEPCVSPFEGLALYERALSPARMMAHAQAAGLG